MYHYDEYDRALVAERVAQFRDQVSRRLSGELSEEEFLPLRLQNGLYLQRHAYMLRVAIPYGTLSADQLRTLASVARDFDRGYGHFTTRQNIQFNWIELEQVGDILARLAAVDMHAIQTSGNCVRNISTDAFAGVAADELLDPRPLAEILRQWSTVNPEFLYLPRKFKIALCSASEDRAAVMMHDIGLYLYRDGAGEMLFDVMVGGGLGRTPILSQPIRKALPWQHLLSYVEAVLRVYNRHGRRDNKYKARIKILVKALGIEAFAREVEAEWEHIKNGPAELTREEYERVAASFQPSEYPLQPAVDLAFGSALARDAEFARWVQRNTLAHKQPGYVSVTLSTKPGADMPPGDVTAEQMEQVALMAERFGFGEIRVAHERPRTESGAAGCRQGRPVRALAAGLRIWSGDTQYRPADRCDCLPRRRLLFAGQRQVHPGGTGYSAALCRPRAAAGSGRNQLEHLGLHERLWSSSHWQYRHSWRR